MHWRNINPFLLLLWITAYHQNSFLTRPETPPRAAIRSWTQLLIVWRLNLVCHQIPVGGRDEDVVQRAGRPLRRLRLTPTDTSSRKSHQQFPLKPRGLTSFGTLTPHVVVFFFFFLGKMIVWQLQGMVCLQPGLSTYREKFKLFLFPSKYLLRGLSDSRASTGACFLPFALLTEK